jgi:hypothetical protein
VGVGEGLGVGVGSGDGVGVGLSCGVGAGSAFCVVSGFNLTTARVPIAIIARGIISRIGAKPALGTT